MALPERTPRPQPTVVEAVSSEKTTQPEKKRKAFKISWTAEKDPIKAIVNDAFYDKLKVSLVRQNHLTTDAAATQVAKMRDFFDAFTANPELLAGDQMALQLGAAADDTPPSLYMEISSEGLLLKQRTVPKNWNEENKTPQQLSNENKLAKTSEQTQ